jgi:hypothetical protein
MANGPIAHHVILHLEHSRVIAEDTSTRRRIARSLLRIGGPFGLLSFGIPDTHGHLVAVCRRIEAVELARRSSLAISRIAVLDSGFAKPRIKPIYDQFHLTSAFHYALRQKLHHGVHTDPTFDACNLPDLLGMRVIDQLARDNVARWLPRLTRASLLPHLGGIDLRGASLQLEDLADAAAGAFALGDLRGSGADAVAARLAAVHSIASTASTSAIADALGVSPQTIRRLRGQPCPAHHERAVAMQLRLRDAVRQRTSLAWAAPG